MTDDSKPKDDERDPQEEERDVVASKAEPSAHEPDEDDEDDDEDEDEVEAAASKPSAAPARRSASSSASKGSSVRKVKKKKKGVPSSQRSSVAKARPTRPSSTKSGSSVGAIAAVALIIGAAAGWFANQARGKSPGGESHVAMADGEGPCKAWEKEVCKGAGEQSAACTQAKGVAELMPDAACGTALEDVPATLEKVKAARADCTKLVSKLCKDLGEQTGTCKMVTERTESFPKDRCKEMLGNYDKVLGQLKAMEERGGPGGPHGGPPGHPGGPPGAPPRPHAGSPAPGGAAPPGAVRVGSAKAPQPAKPAAPAGSH